MRALITLQFLAKIEDAAEAMELRISLEHAVRAQVDAELASRGLDPEQAREVLELLDPTVVLVDVD